VALAGELAVVAVVVRDFTRADAVRSPLTRALDQIEGSSASTKRGGR
jgi:hypothetical protein